MVKSTNRRLRDNKNHQEGQWRRQSWVLICTMLKRTPGMVLTAITGCADVSAFAITYTFNFIICCHNTANGFTRICTHALRPNYEGWRHHPELINRARLSLINLCVAQLIHWNWAIRVCVCVCVCVGGWVCVCGANVLCLETSNTLALNQLILKSNT